MKHTKVILVIAVLSPGLFVVGSRIGVLGEEPLPTDSVAIDVSPKVVNLESNSTWVTVHTDILFSEYDEDSVGITLDGKEVSWTKSDLKGFLVAKFDASGIKNVLDEGDVAVTFTYTEEGAEPRIGSDTLTVISVSGTPPSE